MQSLAVTGGSGFIGRHLLEALRGRDDVRMRVLSRAVSDGTADQCDETLQWVHGDLLREESLADLIDPGAVVINLAYLTSSSRQENLQAVINLVNAAAQRGARRIIHCSTAVVVGRSPCTTITEETVCAPHTDYEKTKYALEDCLLEAAKGKLEATILRPTAVFGPNGMNLMTLAASLAAHKRFANTLRAALFGSRAMNLVSVHNVVAALCLLSRIEHSLDGEIFLVSDDGDPRNNFRDVACQLSEQLDPGRSDLALPALPPFILSSILRMMGRSNTNIERRYSSRKITDAGYHGVVTLETALDEFASWYKASCLTDTGRPT